MTLSTSLSPSLSLSKKKGTRWIGPTTRELRMASYPNGKMQQFSLGCWGMDPGHTTFPYPRAPHLTRGVLFSLKGSIESQSPYLGYQNSTPWFNSNGTKSNWLCKNLKHIHLSYLTLCPSIGWVLETMDVPRFHRNFHNLFYWKVSWPGTTTSNQNWTFFSRYFGKVKIVLQTTYKKQTITKWSSQTKITNTSTMWSCTSITENSSLRTGTTQKSQNTAPNHVTVRL